MYDWFEGLHPIIQALLAGGFTWFITALGATLVFLTKKVPPWLLDMMLGFAAGVMVAASVWSLIIPSIELAQDSAVVAWFPAAVGVVAGAAFVRVADQFMPHLHPGQPGHKAEGRPTTWANTTLLVLAITLHNIPEGLAVGVAFGALANPGIDVGGAATLATAVALAIGIGLQNLPEGISVAMPLRGVGVSRPMSFFYGQLSAAVEPVAAVIGAVAVVVIAPILPYALAFAAGAMLYVVIEELIPESHHAANGETAANGNQKPQDPAETPPVSEASSSGHSDLATFSAIVGFVVMMILDVALG